MLLRLYMNSIQQSQFGVGNIVKTRGMQCIFGKRSEQFNISRVFAHIYIDLRIHHGTFCQFTVTEGYILYKLDVGRFKLTNQIA